MAKDAQVEIEKLTKRLNEWRRDRDGGDRRIPQALWREAGLLAAAHGIGAVARSSGLNYGQVKARMPSVKAAARHPRTMQAEEVAVRAVAVKKKPDSPFVELPMHLPRPVATCMVVEVRSGSGDFMRIENGNTAEVAALVGALLRRA